MNKEQQIKEMREQISDFEQQCRSICKDAKCVECRLLFAGMDCHNQYIAEHLYEAGYRKQSEGEWSFNGDYDCFVCSVCGHSALDNYRGLSVNSNFCPNCGAKMKGGVE